MSDEIHPNNRQLWQLPADPMEVLKARLQVTNHDIALAQSQRDEHLDAVAALDSKLEALHSDATVLRTGIIVLSVENEP